MGLAVIGKQEKKKERNKKTRKKAEDQFIFPDLGEMGVLHPLPHPGMPSSHGPQVAKRERGGAGRGGVGEEGKCGII